MYKRKTKTGSLGIVRSISKTQQNVSDKSEKTIPSPTNSNEEAKKPVALENPPKGSSSDDPDEVLSDSEPSPKKSRRFLSDSSSNMREISFNNTGVGEFKSVSHDSNLNKPNKKINNIDVLTKNVIISQNANRINGKTKMKEVQSNIQNNAKKNNRPHKKGRSYLEEVFEKAGLVLSDGTSPNILNTDQAIFIRDITTAITKNDKELKKNVENIMKDLEEYCSSDKCFKFAISCTETDSECEVSRGSKQDSLMRLLLHVDALQVPVTELLMDKLAKFVMDECSIEEETALISWVRMVLQCFRFLDQMRNGSLVSERLLDLVLATSDVTIQQEVVLSLPDIISDAEHHHTALELSKLVRKSSPQLRASVLEALNNLSLQAEVRNQIQPILMKALHKVQPEFLPTIIKFLLTDCDVPTMDEMIKFLRNELDLATGSDTASTQVLVFSTLRDAMLASRLLPNVWQRNISNVKTQAEHKPMDIIMLLILHSVLYDPIRQRSIEAVFRSKIRSDLFTESLINETLENYTTVIKEYFQSMIRLAGALLRSTEPAVVEFASKMYMGVFVHMEGLWCKWAVSELQLCVGAGDSNLARAALNILQHLTDNYLHRLKPHSVLLMMLLNKLEDLALSEVCQLMDVLCHIAYSADDSDSSISSFLQDEINILVQKQLASSQLSVLRCGVVGCVMTIKHITSVAESNSESSLDQNQPTGKAKKAVQFLELLLSSTRSCVETHGLALDQLAHLLLSGPALDPTFMEPLSTLMRDNLQDAFLITASDFVSKDSDELKSSPQFYLDDDTEGAIALNLLHLVATETDSTKTKPLMSVSCLHPLLRLLRGLEIGDLSEIDALLGCAIILPLPSLYAEFAQLSPFQQHVALHCLFHCVNWLHEVINCFAYLVKKDDPDKVVIRLRTIVWLRGLLTHCLPLAVEYTPPTCHFQALLKPKINTSEKPKKAIKKKGKKKGKKKQVNEESVLTGNENVSQAEEEEEEAVQESAADLTKYKLFFRELDFDVMLILTQPLTLSPTPEKNGQFSAELGPKELLFLLDDFVAKLCRVLTASRKRMSFLKTAATHNVGFDNLDKFTPLHIAKNTLKLLPNLCSFLEKTMEFTQNLVTVNDGVLDATGMFIEGAAEIKQCQTRLFRILATLFSWVGFQNEANTNYLLAGLQQVASRLGSERSKSKSRKLLVRECVQYLTQCKDHVLDLSTACALVQSLTALVHHADHDVSLTVAIASVCKEFVGRQWYDWKGNREKGAVLNNQAAELMTGYLSLSEDQLDATTAVVCHLGTEAQQLTDKDATLPSYPAFSRTNLHVLIAGLLRGLEAGVKQKLDSGETDRQQLEVWSSLTQSLETLVLVLKAHDSKPNLRSYIKGCTTVLKQFLTHGMSTCTFMFKHEPALVSQILKKLQVTTRYIQTICNFVKVSKDTSLTQYLPPIRAVLESILLRVKSIIVINNCTDAFFMGSMKNRDLKGQEILSQEIEADEAQESEIIQNHSDSESEARDNSAEDTDSEQNNESISI